MTPTLCAVFLVLVAGRSFSQTIEFKEFVTEYTKGCLECLDKLQETGTFGIKHGDCFAEMDKKEIHCPDQHVLEALKVRVKEDGAEVIISIPAGVVGQVYAADIPIKWVVTVARRSDLCRSAVLHPPTVVTVYTACSPILL